MAEHDPRQRVEITKVDKRGETVVVEGIVGGKKVALEVGAHAERTMPRKEFEKFLKRSLYGVASNEELRR